MFGMSDMTLSFEGSFGNYMSSRGHEIDFLLCNAGLDSCIFDSKEHLKQRRGFKEKLNRTVKCNFCYLNAKRVISTFNFPHRILDLSKFEIDKDFCCSVEEHAISTTMRNLLIGRFEHDSDAYEVMKEYDSSGRAYASRLSTLFNRENYDLVLCVHGIYLEHGVLIDVARKFDISVYIYGFPYRNSTFQIFKNDTYHRAIFEIPQSHWESFNFNELSYSVVNEYLMSKSTGGRDQVNYHPNPVLFKDDVLNELGLADGSKVTTFYTNVLWDANIFYGDSLFDGGIEGALVFLINEFIRKPDEFLIIRIHPAESKGGFATNKTFLSVIGDYFPELPANIVLIDASSNISSYTLASLSHNNIIYGSNIGLELACRGFVVTVIGDAFIKGLPFVYTPKSLDELSALLFDVNLVLTEDNRLLALKYFYFINFRVSIDLDFGRYNALSLIQEEEDNFKEALMNNFDSMNFQVLAEQMEEDVDFLDYRKFNLGLYE